MRAPGASTLASFRDAHRGGAIVVCGCGVSLGGLTRPGDFVTIGVNDVGRRFHPDYLVVVNPPEQFTGDRFDWVVGSRARYLFTQLELPVPHPDIVRFQLGTYGGTDCGGEDVLHYTRNSPYVALCLAAYMGATRIGLIGVDFTEHHFFGPTGSHPLAGLLPTIDDEYRRLGAALRAGGVEVYNLSRESRLTAFPKITLDEFRSPALGSGPPRGLRLVSYATTPVAGVPAILARCIAARTDHACRCVWAQAGYDNGVSFDGDIEWVASPAEAEAELRAADLVIVHNGKIEPQHRPLLADKAVVTLAHNYGWNVDTALVEQGYPGLVVGQYQATLPEFAGWTAVPNPVPLWEAAFQPGDKPSTLGICYTPSGRHERYAGDDRLYWHSKGYDTTVRVLRELAEHFPIRVETLAEGPVSHAEALAMKRRSHIVVDECVTGSYHRNSLEGLAAGCVVVNGMGLQPAIVEALGRCTGPGVPVPFVRASLGDLRDVLAALIVRGREALVADGLGSRRWMETHWDFPRQWERFWMPAIDAALRRHRGPGSGRPVRSGRRAGACVSVVIPHGGCDRLPHLEATLANLQGCDAAREVIVAEMGAVPVASALARRWGAKYVFVRSAGDFERARALNVGSALASCDLILWKDNDLLMEPGFVAVAAAEAHDRELDYLIPYCSIGYLSEPDTRAVLGGTVDPAAARPVKTLFSGRDVSGGAGIVRKGFLTRYGGMSEEFKGWGGEDNAWLHKVTLLGQWGVTKHREQRLHHLFHPGSGAYRGGPPRDDPAYTRNLSLLLEIKAIHSREHFLERFPPPSPSCPWPRDRRIRLVTSGAASAAPDRRGAAVARAFRALFDVDVEAGGADDDEQASRGLPPARPDAVVVMGHAPAVRWLSSSLGDELRSRTVVVLDTTADEAPPLQGTFARLVPSCPEPRAPDDGVQRWPCPSQAEGDAALAIALAQPLSLVLGRIDEPLALPPERAVTLPVWMYWEGECPEWIDRCEQTVRAHAPDVRRLGWTEFDRLWDRDRDIDIRQLAVAHRADFVRAFLLARFGGLWIDADCVVMQSLEPALQVLHSVDFLGHRDRQGFIPNGFIGARPGSIIAETLYRRICDILRSRRPLGWISLGGEPLTEILGTTTVPWRELPCEAIQPICWSQPGAFFEVATPAEHARRVNESSLCYMLSNTEIQKFRTAHPTRELLDSGTFFRYLVATALAAQPAAPAAVVRHRPAPTFHHLPFYLDAVRELAPARMLEIGVARGAWGALVRELADGATARSGVEARAVWLDAIPDAEARHAPPPAALYDRILTGEPGEMLERAAERWDLSVFTRPLDDWARDRAQDMLRRALAVSDYVLVTSALRDGPGGDRVPVGDRESWSLGDFITMDPVRMTVQAPSTGSAVGVFLLSQRDPRALKRPSPMHRVFREIFLSNRQLGGESWSGPGSSLLQTAEIRRRLPLALQHLGVRALLDAPCGDFNWMKTLALDLEEYVGVDVVGEIVELNRARHGAPGRRFVQLDLTADPLPRADLILCRDCLGHFAYRDIVRALANFKRSGSRLLMTTTFPAARANIEIVTGDWRPLNLELPPFNLPSPLMVIDEQCTEAEGRYADKSLGVWRLQDLPL